MSENGATQVAGAVRRTGRRGVVRSMLAVLLVLFALAVTAQPAAADDPGATYFPHDYDSVPNADIVTCYTPFRTGVLYQYGAWGYFVDGCTVKAWCPNYATRCRATGFGVISTYYDRGHRVTLNSRVRGFASNGAVLGWEDRSCAGYKYCEVYPGIVRYILPGQAASEQCNGVRENAPNIAQVRCQLFLEYLYS